MGRRRHHSIIHVRGRLGSYRRRLGKGPAVPEQCKARNHGAAGYRAGGRCSKCRKGHADANARYRENKRLRDAGVLPPPAIAERPPVETSSAPVDWSAPAGQLEQIVELELGKLSSSPAWKDTLFALARYNARVLDQIPKLERYDLASGIQSRFLNVLDRLDRGGPAGGAAAGPAVIDWDAAAAALGAPE
jgi:hypothetical protein